MSLNNLSPKQQEVLECFVYDNPKIMICSGAKRAGKTFILTQVFINHVATFRNKGLSFIIGGTTQASIRRNILNDLEGIIGREITLAKDNHFKLFGNKIYCFDGANADSYKKVRGFTAYGAFLNEATTLHDTFVKECISRCSGEGARIYMDTNPENPTHTVKVDYVDKDGQRLENGQLNIKSFNFTLFDNTFLNSEYVESIIASTPSGMFTDRDIYGVWVASEGVVYQDFNKDKHYIKELPKDIQIKKYFCGVDWGYEHNGSIVVLAEDYNENYYLIKEIAYQHKEIDFWVEEARKIVNEHGRNIPFYCDTARPEHIARFKREGFYCPTTDKSVLSGIEVVAKLLKANKLFILEDNVKLFKDEIYNYVWSKGKDEPVKQNDDILDALRYAIYNEYKKKNKPKGFINV